MDTRNCCGLIFNSTNNRCTSPAMFSAWLPVIRKPIIRTFRFVHCAAHPRTTRPNSTPPRPPPPPPHTPPPPPPPPPRRGGAPPPPPPSRFPPPTKIVAAVVNPTS